MATLYAGTSGFAYPAWKPGFYPAKLASKEFLRHYAERLNCVEINYTFRRLPSAATLESWVSATPAGFDSFAPAADLSAAVGFSTMRYCQPVMRGECR